MITTCAQCGKKYRLDPAIIKGAACGFTCRNCGHHNIVKKPHESPAAAVLQPIGIASPPENRTEKPISFEKSKNHYSLKQSHRLRFGLMAKLFTIMVLIGLIPLIICWALTYSGGRARVDFLIIAIACVAALAWLSSRALANPIIKLTEAVYRISIGDLDKEIIIKRSDEIGDLSDAVVRMQDSLKISIEKLQNRP